MIDDYIRDEPYIETDKLEITSAFPAVGLDEGVLNVKYQEIRKSEAAFKIFLNTVYEKDKIYSKTVHDLKKSTDDLNAAKEKVFELEKRSSERFSAVIITAVAEVVTAIGISLLSPSENKLIPIAVIIAGIIMTGVSLWLNFKPTKQKSKSEDIPAE